ncbi:tRNA pseudouridine(13) synthase TruD [Vibrio hippocampi]|uniref:tRNA pseudouridine synthase D n=1 Tax=Vibrio hippocampi TaxID=654686 RepID=A0ABM8ZJN7_9VIBR|nr:tRNA pseudouridine(13) synthase TruD [Vibrio hippocampi]CAH0527122.1 tRNA pseudouridine synthase D [Vibrio hippocampi]
MTDILENLAYLNGKPQLTANYKAQNQDFIVKEVLGFPFSGEGEHLMVRIRKNGENTSFVANELAKVCGVKSKDIGWAGLKDRHAITEQWLSVHLPKKQLPDFGAFQQQYPSIEVLATDWHNKKLRPGDLIGNEFEIRLTSVSDMDALVARLALVTRAGVPNYFGEQRFGHEGNNVTEARRWGRDNVRTRNQNKRSLYLSAARSWIFNHIVSKRLNQGCFDQTIAGDMIEFDGQFVLASEVDLASREDWNITAAMAGDNALPTQEQALELEQSIVDQEPDLMKLIRGNRMRHDRRNIVLLPQQFSYQAEENSVVLKFFLDSGSFATSVLRELAQLQQVERQF